MEKLLSEEESARVAGVTVDTIRKYKQCGLLDPIVKENQTFFQELDIRTLFYIQEQAAENEAAEAPRSEDSPAEAHLAEAQRMVDDAPPSPERTSNGQAGNKQARDKFARDKPARDKPARDKPESATASEQPASGADASFPNPGRPFDDREGEAHSEAQADPQPSSETSPETATAAGQQGEGAQEARDAEFVQYDLALTPEVLQLNRGLRDQIQLLREERDWLRKRIEKLESRSEREHMLLLSDGEALRSALRDKQESKKGFLRRALPWLHK